MKHRPKPSFKTELGPKEASSVASTGDFSTADSMVFKTEVEGGSCDKEEKKMEEDHSVNPTIMNSDTIDRRSPVGNNKISSALGMV